jgi:diadenosine tetraphosphate (Ap4A) HIT family hydrolase
MTMFELHPVLAADTLYLGDFALSALLMSKDANYPWFILVPRQPDIQEIYQLDQAQRTQLLKESCLLAEVLQKVYAADKLNIAALGNVVPQLHVHHIVRYRHDAAWPAPVWGAVGATKYTKKALNEGLDRVFAALSQADFRIADGGF